MGRPRAYTPELGDLLCAEIAEGKSMARICNGNEALPTARTVYKWLREEPEFLRNYELAKADQADFLAEEILEIADNGSNDWIAEHGDDGAVTAYKLNGEAIQRSRLRVDARKWIASKLKPKKYGDRQTQELALAEGSSKTAHEILVSFIESHRSDDDGRD